MGKRAGMYKSEKRKKELKRQHKKEEKRQKRLHKDAAPQNEADIAGVEDAPSPETEES